MSFATRLRQRAFDLIEEYGMTAVFYPHDTTATYSPATGAVTNPAAPSPVTRKVSPPSPHTRGFFEQSLENDANTAIRGKLKVIVAALGLTFSVDKAEGMKITLDGQTWKVIHVEPLKAQDLAIAYILALE